MPAVYLLSSVILIVSTALLASPLNNSYNFHLGFRCMLGVAAGQSEALVPLILKVRLDTLFRTLPFDADPVRRKLSSFMNVLVSSPGKAFSKSASDG